MADQFNSKTLHKAMVRSLDVGDLRTICQYLSVNPLCKGLQFSDLEGTGITGKSLSLIDYCQKRQALTALIDTINEDWEVVFFSGKYVAWRSWAMAEDSSEVEQSGQNSLTEAPQLRRISLPGAAGGEQNERHIAELSAQLDSHLPRTGLIGELFDESPMPDLSRSEPVEIGEKIPNLKGLRLLLAIANYKRTIGIDPSNADAYLGRGRAYWDMGNKSLAKQDWQRAAELGSAEAKAELEKQ